jgi:hypothetical protein
MFSPLDIIIIRNLRVVKGFIEQIVGLFFLSRFSAMIATIRDPSNHAIKRQRHPAQAETSASAQ